MIENGPDELSIKLTQIDKNSVAYYDTIENEINFILTNLEKFDKKYKDSLETIEVIPDYDSKILEIYKIVEKIKTIDNDTRGKQCELIEQYYFEINEIFIELTKSSSYIEQLSFYKKTDKEISFKKWILIALYIIIGFSVAFFLNLSQA
jgi:isoleucyl-tRNA synthetase